MAVKDTDSRCLHRASFWLLWPSIGLRILAPPYRAGRPPGRYTGLRVSAVAMPGDDEPADPNGLDLDLGSLSEAFGALSNQRRLALLAFLAEPHYVREIASHLGIARQAAKKHVDKLVEAGLVEKRRGERESGPVTVYVLVPERMFELKERFSHLGKVEAVDDRRLKRTRVDSLPTGTATKAEGPALVVAHGRDRGRVFPLAGEEPWLVGRDPENDVALDYDPFASNRHAEVRRDQESHRVVDRFSTNGTYRNWERLDRGGEAPLTEGDVLGVGKTLLVFWASPAPK